MATQFPRLAKSHTAFIEAQKVFFVATAGPDGRVNLSPKGMDSLRVIDANRIHWLNLTGSGNETAGHLLQNPRMTLMWCAFDDPALILRAYGTAHAIHRNDPEWSDASASFTDAPENRQIFDLQIEMVQTSCGDAVPFMDYRGDRSALRVWADDKGVDGLKDWWADRNAATIDGAPTGIEEGNL
jgi:hypothetical protein